MEPHKKIYGASSPKTVLGLIQLIKYKGTKRALTRNEVHDLLTYTKKAYRGPDGRGSNAVNRGISGTFRPGSGLDPHKRKGLGKVMPGDDKITGVVDVFDVRNSGFLWGRSSKGGNQQTPRDMFKIFGGLERMYTGKFLNDKEKKFYKQNSQSVNTIYEIQNKRKHSPNIRLSGVTREDHWGKGGRAMHAVSHTFVINRSGRKYVMSVYVDLGNQYGKSQGGDHEGYAVLNTILAKLLERMR